MIRYRRLTDRKLTALPSDMRAEAEAFRAYLDAVQARATPERLRKLGNELENIIRGDATWELEMGTYRPAWTSFNDSTAH